MSTTSNRLELQAMRSTVSEPDLLPPARYGMVRSRSPITRVPDWSPFPPCDDEPSGAIHDMPGSEVRSQQHLHALRMTGLFCRQEGMGLEMIYNLVKGRLRPPLLHQQTLLLQLSDFDFAHLQYNAFYHHHIPCPSGSGHRFPTRRTTVWCPGHQQLYQPRSSRIDF